MLASLWLTDFLRYVYATYISLTRYQVTGQRGELEQSG